MGVPGQEGMAGVDQGVGMDLATGNPLFAQIGDALLAQVKLSMDPFGEPGTGKTEPPTQSPFHSGTPGPSTRLPHPTREDTSKNLIVVNENDHFQDPGQMPTRRPSNNFNQPGN